MFFGNYSLQSHIGGSHRTDPISQLQGWAHKAGMAISLATVIDFGRCTRLKPTESKSNPELLWEREPLLTGSSETEEQKPNDTATGNQRKGPV